MNKIILFGNGSVAQNHCHLLSHDSEYDVVAFSVDRPFLQQDSLMGRPVVPWDEVEDRYPSDAFKMHIAVGYVQMNRLRAARFTEAKAKGYHLISYIHSRAITSEGLEIGENCWIGAGSIIGTFVRLGDNVSLASGVNLGHHTVIRDHCFLASGVVISGNVTVEPYCILGANVTVRDRVTLASETVVGAGGTILEDTEEKGVYLGPPAEKLPIRSDQLKLS
jgi:sugar O-acyltransferase (sialic acid O-acetyltransferase NeuD family)